MLTPVRITYTLTPDDFVEVYRLRRSETSTQRWTSRIVLFLFAIILVGGAILLASEPTRTTASRVIPIYGIAALWFWFSRWFPVRFARKQFNSQPAAQQEQKTEFSDSGIRTSTPHDRESFVPWNAVERFRENNRVLLLYLPKGLFVVYPKRAFEPAQLAAVIEHLRGLAARP